MGPQQKQNLPLHTSHQRNRAQEPGMHCRFLPPTVWTFPFRVDQLKCWAQGDWLVDLGVPRNLDKQSHGSGAGKHLRAAFVQQPFGITRIYTPLCIDTSRRFTWARQADTGVCCPHTRCERTTPLNSVKGFYVVSSEVIIGNPAGSSG